MALTASLTDTFATNTLATNWPNSYGAPSVVGGRGRIPTTTGYAAIESSSTYTLQGSSLFARLYPPSATGATADSDIAMDVVSTTPGFDVGVIINVATNTIKFKNNGSAGNAYSDPNAVTITYNSTSHAYIRIRESAGSVFWDTSPDGTTWTVRRSTNNATPSWMTATGNQRIAFTSHRDTGTTDFAEIDNVNSAPITTAAISTLVEDFSGTLTTLWNVPTSPAGVAIVAGELPLTTQPATYYGVTSKALYNLAASSLYWRFKSPTSMASTHELYTELIYDVANKFAFDVISPTQMALSTTSAGVTTDSYVSYNPATELWFRIRESAGTVYYETAATATGTYTARATHTHTLTSTMLAAISVGMWAGDYGSATFNATGTWDNFNTVGSTATTPVTKTGAVLWNVLAPVTGQTPGKIWNPAVNGSIVSGRYQIANAGTTQDYITSVSALDLVGSSLTVELYSRGTTASTDVGLTGFDGTGGYMFNVSTTGVLSMQVRTAGGLNDNGAASVTGTLTLTYDATAHHWLRIRDIGNAQVVFETAPDSGAPLVWTVRRTAAAANGIDPTGLQIRLGSRSGTSTFDNVNNPPVNAGSVPTIPLTVTASAGINSANVSWIAPTTPGAGFTGYEVRATPIPPTGPSVVSVGNVLSYTWPSVLSAGTAYTFYVRGLNAAGAGPEASATATPTAPVGVPSAPTVTAVTETSPNRVSVTWTAPSAPAGLTGYRVYLAGSVTATGNVLTLAWPTALVPGTYAAQVSAVNATGEGPRSTAVSITVGGTVAPIDQTWRLDVGAATPTTGWDSDALLVTGGTPATSTIAVSGRPKWLPAGVFSTLRTGAQSFSIPVPTGLYTVDLVFAESVVTSVGGRVFDAVVNGARLDSLDIVAGAGGPNRVYVRTFVTNDVAGKINVSLTAHPTLPLINAVRVMPVSGSLATSATLAQVITAVNTILVRLHETTGIATSPAATLTGSETVAQVATTINAINAYLAAA